MMKRTALFAIVIGIICSMGGIALADTSIQVSKKSVILNPATPDQKRWVVSKKDAQIADDLILPFLRSEKALYQKNLKDFQGTPEEKKKYGSVVTLSTNRIEFIEKNFDHYHRQYVGQMKDGRKIIWINFFWNDDNDFLKSWTQEPLYVEDGGAHYFNLKVDAESKTCFDLYINGDA